MNVTDFQSMYQNIFVITKKNYTEHCKLQSFM